MLRNWSKAVPEGNGTVPQQEEFGSDQPTLADVYRMIEELFDKSSRKMDELAEEMRETDQRFTSLEQAAWQPRLAMEADVQADKKTRERTESAPAAVQAMHGDSLYAKRVDPDPKRSTSFGDDSTGPPVLRCSRNDAQVGNGAEATNSYISPLEMRSRAAAGGLLPTGKAYTTTRITYISAASSVLPNRGNEF